MGVTPFQEVFFNSLGYILGHFFLLNGPWALGPWALPWALGPFFRPFRPFCFGPFGPIWALYFGPFVSALWAYLGPLFRPFYFGPFFSALWAHLGLFGPLFRPFRAHLGPLPPLSGFLGEHHDLWGGEVYVHIFGYILGYFFLLKGPWALGPLNH